MNVVHERCCGLDVHKAPVVACRLTLGRKEASTFSDHNARFAGFGRLADRRWYYRGRDGVYGRVLEARLQRARVNRPRGDGSERSPHQGGPMSEDRRQRRRMDCRPPEARSLEGELYSRPRASRAARAGALPEVADPAAQQLGELSANLLREVAIFQDLGAAVLDERQQQSVVRHSVKRLERLGYRVTESRNYHMGYRVTLTPNAA